MSAREYHCHKCGVEVLAGPYVVPELCGACQLTANAKRQESTNEITPEMIYRVAELHGTIKEQAKEIERLRRLLAPVRPDTDIEKGKPLSTPNDYLTLLSSYIADCMPSEAVPDDEYFGAWERAARPILQRLFDEIERLRALSVRATEKE